jgi:hypothetical protein
MSEKQTIEPDYIEHPNDINVTGLVNYGDVDGEYLPLTKCICGYRHKEWDFNISIYHDNIHPCPQCGRKLYFENNIQVYEKRKD